MAVLHKQINQYVFPQGCHLVHPEGGSTDRRITYAMFDQDMQRIAPSEFILKANGDIVDEDGTVLANSAALVTAAQAVETLLTGLSLALNGA